MTLKELITAVEGLDIIEVAQTCLGLRFTQSGVRYQCLCPNPYHQDKHIGSFSIRRDQKIWGCFACDMGQHRGNTSLVAAVRGISYPAAAAEIGAAFGLISPEEGRELVSNHEVKRSLSQAPKSYGGSIPDYITKRKDPATLDKVYRCFVQAAPKMTEDQRLAFMAERHLSEADLEDFFLMPAKTPAFWEAFRKALASAGFTGSLSNVLTGVPGFYCYKSNHRWSFKGNEGDLGVISRDIDGLICGLQIRRKTAGHGGRYICFSTGSMDPEEFENLCSCGVLVSVEKPRVTPKPVIAITEGKFKALTLAKMGYWTICVSGVGSWKKTIPVIQTLLKRTGIAPNFLIAFDMDLKFNENVAKAAGSLGRCLEEKFRGRVEIADWDPELGKGIDDLVNNGHGDTLTFVPFKNFKAA